MNRRPASREDGSVSIEFAILAPTMLVLFAALTVYAGRQVTAGNDVRSAAHAGARAASLASSTAAADDAARTVVAANLAQAGVGCSGGPQVTVDVDEFSPGGQVTVTVTCTVELDDLISLGPGNATVEATGTEVVDQYRSARTGEG